MKWTERIEEIEGRHVPILVDKAGERRIGRPGEIRFLLPDRGRKLGRIEDVDLAGLERVDARPYLDALGLHDVSVDGQHVYALVHGGQEIHIPASLLLTTVLGRPSIFGDLLLSPAGLERGLMPILGNGQPRVVLPRRRGMSNGGDRHIQERLLWLSCFPSARRMWTSVYRHARQGSLGLTPANARVDATFSGLKPGNIIFATNLNLRSLTPTEQPLPFASSMRDRVFDLEMGTSKSYENLRSFKENAALHPAAKEVFDVPSVNGRWCMNEVEWAEVLRVLAVQGFRCAAKTKATMDAALKKWGTGVHWHALEGDAHQIENTYRVWKMRGKWDILKEVLRELRAGPPQKH